MKIKYWLPLILILLFFSGACGKKKAQVKAPTSRPTPTAAAKKAPAAKQPQTQPSQPVNEERPTSAVVPTFADTEFAPGPAIRIGLVTAAKEIRISSSGEYTFMEKIPEAPQEPTRGEIQIRVEQGPGEATAIYRIQVASLSSDEAADDLKARLVAAFQYPVVIRVNPDTGTNQVRIGEFSTREDAQPLLKDLGGAGYRDAFLVRDTISAGSGKASLALRGSNDLFRTSPAGFLVQPSSSTAFLCLDGKCYRGLLDVFLNKNGRMTVVNQLGTEDYLLSVVPAEMSPKRFPELAALSALAVAARTYALKNVGRYRTEGFDLTNDTRTQVYGGVSVEDALTNEAVHRTSGLAAYYDSKLIDAMYMSTCGGRTEDFSAVFDAPDVPYLKSVFCAIESGPEKGATVLEGSHALDQPILSEDGSLANRNIELAKILGIVPPDTKLSPEFLSDSADRDEILSWVERARKITGKTRSDPPPPSGIGVRSGLFKFAAESFFGSGEIRRKMSTRDVDYYMGNLEDGKDVPESARPALAYLMQAGVWKPSAGNTVRPDAPVRRMDALFLILNCVESIRPDTLSRGSFVAAKPDEDGGAASVLTIKVGKRSQEYRLSDKPYIYRSDAGRTTPVSSAKIIGNEKVAFHTGPSGAIDYVEIELNAAGASSDRYSPVASWDTTLTRAAIAEKVRGLAANIGQFKDLAPAKIGNSGRVVQIEVIGTRGSAVVNGYKFRNAVGLRDTLFTLTRETGADGSIESFTFHGRGMGHGVGLCQVGAFGMARAGHSYEDILKAYYQGIDIRKAY